MDAVDLKRANVDRPDAIAVESARLQSGFMPPNGPQRLAVDLVKDGGIVDAVRMGSRSRTAKSTDNSQPNKEATAPVTARPRASRTATSVKLTGSTRISRS